MAQFGGLDILVTPEELQLAAASISSQVEKLQNGFEQLETIADSMNYYWEGEAHDSFRAYYETRKELIDQVMHNMQQIPVVLREMAGVYTEAESINEQVAQELPSDVIQ
ncbi:MAG: WXG100 family type VII secretion target [Lachnospiraceae bacterium]|nr:WXG100 family type VII secretion target [Lachnospiraceae bacterium]